MSLATPLNVVVVDLGVQEMPRKQIIKRKVRRLTPREIDLLVKGVTAYEMEIETDPISVEDHYLKEQEELRGIYRNLAIIVEE